MRILAWTRGSGERGGLRRAWYGLVLALMVPAALEAAPAAAVVTWTYVQQPNQAATGFVVLRCEQTATGCPLAEAPGGAALPLTPTTYTDSTIVAGKTYCYVVIATNAAGQSPPSEMGCGALLNVPNTPTNVVIQMRPSTP